MKIEIVKETKPNGDQYLSIEKDGSYVPTSSSYVGNVLTDNTEILANMYNEAMDKLNELIQIIKQNKVQPKEIIYSEDIE